MSTEALCPQCNLVINTTNRMITDSCGHQKCRNCLLTDEIGCSECTKKQCKEISNKTASYNSSKIPKHIQKLTTESGKEEYQCNACGKKFGSRSQQYYHFGCVNEFDKRFVCSYNECAKRFSTRAHLKYHQESHKPGEYACGHCAKVFKHKNVLQKHERNHETEMETCKICQKTLRNKSTLAAHMALHTHPENRFKCNNCGRTYATKSTLQQHMLKHSVKRYKCPICHKLYQRNSILKLHMQRHNRQEYFSCEKCYKNYTDADALARHTRLHMPTEKYRCKMCDITTYRKDNMQRHVRNMHDHAPFETCVEVVPVETNESINAEETPALPKTIENSSVIKCIGNVKPMIVPAGEQQNQNLTDAQNCTTLETVKQQTPPTTSKKPKYDPIKYYWKILNPDEDDTVSDIDESSTLGDADEDDAPSTSHMTTVNTNNDLEPMTSVQDGQQPLQQQQQRACHGASNFSETHWRKNFKYAYYQNSD